MARRWQKQTPKTKTKTRIPRLNKIPFLMEEPTTAPTVGPATTATANPTKGPTVYPTTAVPIRRPARNPATRIPTAGIDEHRRSRDKDNEREEDVLVYDPSLRHQRRKWDMFKGVLNNFNLIVEYEDDG